MADNMKAFSTKQEKLIAKELGGYPVGMSGAAPGTPGDVKTYDWLVECKTHAEPGHNIFFDIDVWDKIEKEAMAMHRKPVLVVDDGSQSVKTTWCLCRQNSINLSRAITVDWPAAIRKNLTCKDSKLSETLKKQTKRYLGDMYQTSAYEINWSGRKVVVVPFSTFKELFDK